MLFDRKCQIEIGKPGQPGKLIEGLRMSFTVEKTRTTTPNTLALEVYNLSEASRNALGEKGSSLLLRAGYAGEGMATLFVGAPMWVEHTFPRPDVVSKVECGDGLRELAESQVSISFEAGTPTKQILDEIMGTFGLPVRPLADAISGAFENGFSFVGPAKEALDSVAKRLGFEWSIQNGELQVLKQRGANQSKAVVLTPSTGLLGSPERVKDKGNTIVDLSGQERWKVRCLLQPRIEPGGIVVIESRAISKAEFTVDKVTHRGDTHGDEWETEVEVFRA